MSTNPFNKYTSNLFASRGCDIDEALQDAFDTIQRIDEPNRAHAMTAVMILVNTAANAFEQARGPSPEQEIAAAWVRDLVAQEVDRHAAGLQDKVDDIIKEWIGANLDIEEKVADQLDELLDEQLDDKINDWMNDNLEAKMEGEALCEAIRDAFRNNLSISIN